MNRLEARDLQLLTLLGLFCFGVAHLGFQPWTLVVALLGAAVTQVVCTHFDGKRGRLKSAAITATSLALLLRSESLWGMGVAAVLGIASKTLVKHRDGHIFNPANFAIVVMLLAFPSSFWVSPGQWGRPLLACIAAVCAGVLVVTAARQSLVALQFFLCYGALFMLRAIYLGDPAQLALHHLTNGSLLIFTFFMVTDPRTAPRQFWPRSVYCAATALIAFILETQFYVRTGLFYALAISCAVGSFAAYIGHWKENPPRFWHLRWSRS